MINDIGIFLNYEDEVVQIPVNPSELQVSAEGNNKTVEIIQLGDISILKKRKLQTISWDSWFPYDSWFPSIRTKGQFKRPDFYVDYIEQIRDNCKPCRLIVTGIGINMQVSIEGFSYTHKAGEHEDKYYSISLKEWKPYKIIPVATDQSDLNRWGAKMGTTTQKPAAPAVAPKQVTIGCDVILNGTVHYDSYGAKPGKTFSNYKGKVNFINMKGSHPYHVTTPSGGWLGWVVSSAVQVV